MFVQPDGIATAAATAAALAAPVATGFYYASPDDITMITPMFQCLWGQAHASFSVLLQLMDDPRLVRVVVLCVCVRACASALRAYY